MQKKIGNHNNNCLLMENGIFDWNAFKTSSVFAWTNFSGKKSLLYNAVEIAPESIKLAASIKAKTIRNYFLLL